MVLGRRYKFGLIAVKAGDNAFADMLKQVYGYHECDISSADFVISVSCQEAALWRFAGVSQRRVEGDLPKAIGVFDDIVDQLIKDNVCNDDVLVHASTCIRGGKALSFIGLSGVGKTTIAFMLAKHFGFQELGDEYALLNCETCTISHEFHPLQIKRGSPLFSGCQNGAESFYLESAQGVLCAIASPFDFGLDFSGVSYPLDALIFPLFQQGDRAPALNLISIGELPELLMPSVQRTGPGSDLFKRIIFTLAEHGVRMYSLSYGNPFQACELVASIVCEKELSNG